VGWREVSTGVGRWALRRCNGGATRVSGVGARRHQHHLQPQRSAHGAHRGGARIGVAQGRGKVAARDAGEARDGGFAVAGAGAVGGDGGGEDGARVEGVGLA
jgi:hypothetical protein